jgi:hypothetical protein
MISSEETALATQREKARAFKALHERPDGFIIPNPWDSDIPAVPELSRFFAS